MNLRDSLFETGTCYQDFVGAYLPVIFRQRLKGGYVYIMIFLLAVLTTPLAQPA